MQEETKEVTLALKSLIETLDAHFTCRELYSALGTGVGVTLVAGFFPGVAPIASASTRYVQAERREKKLSQTVRNSNCFL